MINENIIFLIVFFFNVTIAAELSGVIPSENTKYKFTLEDGDVIEVKGNEDIEYDGEIHTAANLYDALKEGYYGKF